MERIALEMDSTQIAVFLECEYKWKLSWLEHLHKNDANMKALDKGSLMHFMLEQYRLHRYDKNNESDSMSYAWDRARERMSNHKQLDEYWKLTPEEVDLIRQRFFQYILRWRDEELETAERNGQPAIELGFSHTLVDNNMFLFNIAGKIDWIAKSRNGFEMFVDYKTQGRQ